MARVLLIDDNSDIQRFVRHHVEHAGHEFLGVTSAEEGRTCAFDRSPDVILLDWMLPRRDGIELCRELKRDLRTCRVPVILLTVRSSPTDKIQAFEAGANPSSPVWPVRQLFSGCWRGEWLRLFPVAARRPSAVRAREAM